LLAIAGHVLDDLEFLLGVARFGPIYIDEPNLLACRL
jgi:hypothetical protein